jgi:hypothetical protein
MYKMIPDEVHCLLIPIFKVAHHSCDGITAPKSSTSWQRQRCVLGEVGSESGSISCVGAYAIAIHELTQQDSVSPFVGLAHDRSIHQ